MYHYRYFAIFYALADQEREAAMQDGTEETRLVLVQNIHHIFLVRVGEKHSSYFTAVHIFMLIMVNDEIIFPDFVLRVLYVLRK